MSLIPIFDLPWWGIVLAILGLTHITIASVTIYLHRHQAHRALDLHPLLAHFFRFWLWLTTGMNTRAWVAVHRKHHAFVEQEADPHSPQQRGINKVLFEGAELYKQEATNQETLASYGHQTPDDWLERNVYRPFQNYGIVLMLLLDVAMFGIIGITVWAVQMAWIPFFAAGVINGIGHWGGYRNYECADASTNIVPWGILIGGEELHNNHHAFASSARFSSKWWELDIGWFYIRLLSVFRLARIRRLAPRLRLNVSKPEIDIESARALVSNRLQIMSRYARHVIRQVYQEEKAKADSAGRRLLKQGRKLLHRSDYRMDHKARQRLESLIQENSSMRVVYEFSQRLQSLWTEKAMSYDALTKALRDWCEQAEATGIEALREFAREIRMYTTAPAMA